MPIEISAPDGSTVRFPDGTDDDTIKSVMRKNYGGPQQPALAAQPEQPEQPAAPRKQAEMKPYSQPKTLSDRLSDLIRSNPRDPEAKPTWWQDYIADKLTGSPQGLGKTGTGGLDFVPGVGQVLAGSEFMKAKDNGDVLGMIANGVGAALPAPGAANTVNRTINAINIARQNGPQADLINAGRRLDVNIPRGATTPDMVQNVTGTLADMPIVGDPLRRAGQESVAQAQEAADRTMQQFGRTSARESGDQAIDTLQEWIRNGGQREVGPLYDTIRQLSPVNVRGDMPATRNMAQNILDEIHESTSTLNAPAVALVEDAATRPQQMSFEGMHQLRRDIGARIDSHDPESGTIKPALRRLYGAITDDMRTLLSQRGQHVVQLFDQAEAQMRHIAETREQVRGIIGNPTTTPGERTVDSLIRYGGSKQGADLAKLEQARRLIPDAEWRPIAGEAIQRLGMDNHGEFSPAIFSRKYGLMTEQGRTHFFGAAGTADRQALDDLAQVGQVFEHMQRLANHSNSARMGMLATMAGSGGAAVYAMVHNPMVLGGMVASAAGTYGVARYLAQPAAIRQIANFGNAAAQAAQAGTPAAVQVFNVAAQELARHIGSVTGEDAKQVYDRLMKPATNRQALAQEMKGRDQPQPVDEKRQSLARSMMPDNVRQFIPQEMQ
jgi:hypothetical protein